MKYIIREKKFYSNLILLALPIILQMLINVGINVTDTMMLSQLGEAQISASSLAGQFMNLFYILCMGFGSGAAVMASQYWGRGDDVSFHKVMTIMMRISIIVSIVFTVFTNIFPGLIMSIYTNEQDVIYEGVRYFRFASYVFVLQGISQPLSLIMRSARKTLIPLLSTIGAFLINIFANWIFIWGNLGAPRMEIAGAALGTLISFVFQAVFVGVYVFAVDKSIGYRLKNLLMPCKDLMREFMKFASPVIASDFLFGLGLNSISVIMGHISSSFVTAAAISMVIIKLCTAFSQGLSSAAAVTIGNTLGAGGKEKAKHQAVTCFMLSIIIGLLAFVVIFLLAQKFVDFYSLTEQTREVTNILIKAAAIAVFFLVVSNMLTKGILRAGGDTKYAMSMDVICIWFIAIPLGALSGLVWGWPPFWIYMCLRTDCIIKSIVGVFRLFSWKWINVVKGKEPAATLEDSELTPVEVAAD